MRSLFTGVRNVNKFRSRLLRNSGYTIIQRSCYLIDQTPPEALHKFNHYMCTPVRWWNHDIVYLFVTLLLFVPFENIFHSNEDVTFSGEGLPYVCLCSVITSPEQWHRNLFIRTASFSPSYDKPGALSIFSIKMYSNFVRVFMQFKVINCAKNNFFTGCQCIIWCTVKIVILAVLIS